MTEVRIVQIGTDLGTRNLLLYRYKRGCGQVEGPCIHLVIEDSESKENIEDLPLTLKLATDLSKALNKLLK